MLVIHNLERAMTPLWQGDTVYDESVMFVQDRQSCAVPPAPLLYDPLEIIGVCSSDFMLQYIENCDYSVEACRIRRLDGGRMPVAERDWYYPREPAQIAIESEGFPGRYVRYDPGGVELARRQVAVSYRHGGRWQGPEVLCQPERLPRTLGRLKSGEPLTLLFYGDSVMEGCDATGRSGIAPYLPQSDELLTLWLAQRYRHRFIRRINTAVGGMDSAWGKDNAAECVAKHMPDLVAVGFGMNDGSRRMPVGEYARNITAIVEIMRQSNPKAEFLLLSPGLPNPDCKGWTGLQEQYAPALTQIEASTPGCRHVPVTAIHRYLYGKKRYDDMNGNNVNHPNDFLARVNAQAMAACLLGD